MTKDTDPSGLEVWVTPPGKEPRLLREEEIEWAAEEGSNKYHLRPRDQLTEMRITDTNASVIFY